MTRAPDHDYIQSYEQAAAGLTRDPGNRALQHKAVLALARAGALDFARAEYERFGLKDVRGDEDITGLRARLDKDSFLRGGADASDYASRSAALYEAAFAETGGYYSGINAATMALMAGLPDATVESRARTIRAALPDLTKANPQDRYYMRATLAESLLLTGDLSEAAEALRSAFHFDPLNYAAHATTLKQFHMIAQKRGRDAGWLTDFSPPRAVHFAGHIFGDDTDEDGLAIALSDMIQARDIGFGYGALAAGADILMAEALIEEGAELHVVLPAGKDVFTAKSVTPFGDDWAARFDACLGAASSVQIVPGVPAWPDPRANRFAGRIAMGRAMMRADMLRAPAGQLLIYHEAAAGSYTGAHACDWPLKDAQFILPLPEYKAKPATETPAALDCNFTIYEAAGAAESVAAQNIGAALKALQSKGSSAGITAGLFGAPADDALGEALRAAVKPGQILLSETAACLLTYAGARGAACLYAGQIAGGARVYSAVLSG